MSVVKVYHGLIYLSPSFSDDGIAISNYSLLLGKGKKDLKNVECSRALKFRPL